MALKRRQKDILQALSDLGGVATTRQIAKKADLNVNGVSQSMGALTDHVLRISGRGGDTVWKVKTKPIAHISPILQQGVIYTDTGTFVITTENMYQPEDATDTNITMFMNGPIGLQIIDAGEYPFTAVYDRLKEASRRLIPQNLRNV